MDLQIFIEDSEKIFRKYANQLPKRLKETQEKFSWGLEENKAFEELKTRFITPPILCHFFPDRAPIVETNSSDFALGCVLSQFKDKRLHPVAFHSPKWSDADRNYKIDDGELLAILEGFNEWPHYLVGTKDPITVYTDHHNLQNI